MNRSPTDLLNLTPLGLNQTEVGGASAASTAPHHAARQSTALGGGVRKAHTSDLPKEV